LNCLQGLCSPTGGIGAGGIEGTGLCGSCKQGKYGDFCLRATRCDLEHGTPNDGVEGDEFCNNCSKGWYGDFCNRLTPCKNGDPDDGVNGTGLCIVCDGGWFGELCDRITPEDINGLNDLAGDGDNKTTIIIASLVGGAFFIIIVALVFMIGCGCCGFACQNKAKEERRKNKVRRLFSYRHNELGDVDNSNSVFKWRYNNMPNGGDSNMELGFGDISAASPRSQSNGVSTPIGTPQKWQGINHTTDLDFDVGLDDDELHYTPVKAVLGDNNLEKDRETDYQLARKVASRELADKALRLTDSDDLEKKSDLINEQPYDNLGKKTAVDTKTE